MLGCFVSYELCGMNVGLRVPRAVSLGVRSRPREPVWDVRTAYAQVRQLVSTGMQAPFGLTAASRELGVRQVVSRRVELS